jgi:hypothetical protein
MTTDSKEIDSEEGKETSRKKPLDETNDLLRSISVYIRSGYTILRNFTVLRNYLDGTVEIRITLSQKE